jgi:hypothetical protein
MKSWDKPNAKSYGTVIGKAFWGILLLFGPHVFLIWFLKGKIRCRRKK